MVANTNKAIAVLGYFSPQCHRIQRVLLVDLIAAVGSVRDRVCYGFPRCYRSFRDECSRSKALFWAFLGDCGRFAVWLASLKCIRLAQCTVYLLSIPAVTAFEAMNFTGSSTIRRPWSQP
jgi:hypothetical protein